MKKTIWMFCAFFGMLLSSGYGLASEETQTRVGTCADARSQQEYFCDIVDNLHTASVIYIFYDVYYSVRKL